METLGIILLSGALVGALIFIYLRTHKERRRTAHEMTQARKEYEDVLEYTMHQLRGPVTVVRGYSSLLFDESPEHIPHELHESLHAIRRSSEHLAVVVEEYRDIQAFERGDIKLNNELTEIDPFVADVVSELKPAAHQRHHALVLHSQKDLPRCLLDKSRVRQVLFNIIENALAYTPDGTDIYIQTHAQDNKILITISDNGPGIPEDELEMIFEKYKRGRHGIARSMGTGLGLYIARTIVRSHGGDIFASRSREYGGASFQIEIPIRN